MSSILIGGKVLFFTDIHDDCPFFWPSLPSLHSTDTLTVHESSLQTRTSKEGVWSRVGNILDLPLCLQRSIVSLPAQPQIKSISLDTFLSNA
jgi:hypothetical protein